MPHARFSAILSVFRAGGAAPAYADEPNPPPRALSDG